MLPIHVVIARRMDARLKTTAMGLGLVRLLRDAGRGDEASAILAVLQGNVVGSATCASASASQGTKVREMRTMPTSIA